MEISVLLYRIFLFSWSLCFLGIFTSPAAQLLIDEIPFQELGDLIELIVGLSILAGRGGGAFVGLIYGISGIWFLEG